MHLKSIAKAKKLTFKSLAEHLGIDPATIWRWEQGKTSPNAEQIKQLCDILGCSYEDLLGAA